MSATAYPQQGWTAQTPMPPATQAWQQPAWSAPTHPGPKTNLLAILSIVAASTGATVLLGIGSIAAIVLGLMALGQIKRTGDDGRLLAIWAIVLGAVSLAALIFSTVLAVGVFVSFAQEFGTVASP